MGPTYGVAPLPEGEGGVYMADAIPAPPEGEGGAYATNSYW
jgi:hypothetical protein